jgi:hypothetical protein
MRIFRRLDRVPSRGADEKEEEIRAKEKEMI